MCRRETAWESRDCRNAKRSPFVFVLVWVYFEHERFESGFRDLTLCVKVLWNQVYPHITHIPGRLNMLADELSRFKEPLSTPLDPAARMTFPWMDLLKSSGIEITQIGRKWPSHFDVHLQEKRLLQSADWVPPSISFWGVLTPAGRLSIGLVRLERPPLFY